MVLLQGGVQRGGFPLVTTGDYHTACIKKLVTTTAPVGSQGRLLGRIWVSQPGAHTSVQVLGQCGGAGRAQHTSGVQLAPGHLTFGRTSSFFVISTHFVW